VHLFLLSCVAAIVDAAGAEAVSKRYGPCRVVEFRILGPLPGERGWIKTKNREYRRWEIECEGVFKIGARASSCSCC
jgi:hypothetical protein